MEENAENQNSEFSDEEVKAILRDALKLKIEEKRKFPEKVQLKKALISVITEFLPAFKIMGYDYDGELINLMCYKTPKDKSALDNAYMEDFSKFISKRG